MNRQEFISYLASPEKLDESSLASLQRIAEEFPYFQTAHLLLARNLHNTDSIHFNEQLKTAAVYAGDRKVLHKLIYKKPEAAGITETEIVHELNTLEPVTVQPEQEEPRHNPAEEILQKALEEIEAIKKRQKELENSIVGHEQETATEHSIPPVKEAESHQEPEVKPAEEKEQPAEETGAEEKKAEETAVQKKEKEDQQEPVVFEEVEKLKKEIKTLDELYVTQAIESSVELDIFKAEKELERQEQEEKKKEKELKEKSPAEKKKKPDLSGRHSFTSWLRSLPEAGQLKQEKKEGDDLIDRFIKEEPRIKPKKEFFSPVNMAKQSVTDNHSLVTETLARIYEKQGAYHKALEAYERLSLLYPEKSAFFAARIEEIRKLIN
ncbi:MAG: hypothetical protein AB1458_16295 [Bacteroidota bacterium]